MLASKVQKPFPTLEAFLKSSQCINGAPEATGLEKDVGAGLDRIRNTEEFKKWLRS
jgi:hypothetical protein